MNLITNHVLCTSNIYSGSILKAIGFPSVSSVLALQNLTIDQFQYDIITREYINISLPYCKDNKRIYDWCCIKKGNKTTPTIDYCQRSNTSASNSRIIKYSYCIISEIWPQQDILSWLNDTSYSTPSVSWVGFREYCSCKMPGRAVFVSIDPSPHPVWNNPCNDEIVLWSFYIFITLIYVILSIYIIYLLLIKILVIGFDKNHAIGVGIALTLACLIICCLLKVAALLHIMITRNVSARNEVTTGWLVFWSGVFLYIATTAIIFTFSNMAETISVIKSDNTKSLFITTLKYFFSMAMTTVIIILIIFQALGSNAANILLDHSSTLNDQVYWSTVLITYFRVVEISSVVIQFIVIISYGIFIFFIFSITGFKSDKNSFLHGFIIRNYYLLIALIAIILFTVVLLVELMTVLYDTGASWSNEEYPISIEKLWTSWLQGFFQIFWILFTALSVSHTKSQRKGVLSTITKSNNASSSLSKLSNHDDNISVITVGNAFADKTESFM